MEPKLCPARRGRSTFLVLLFLVMLMPSLGCVHREMMIYSEPNGARVFVNDVEVGTAPCKVPTNLFQDYGHYKIRLLRQGYEPFETSQYVKAPVYQYFPLDFVSEVLLPFPLHDKHCFTYQMQPIQDVPNAEVQQRAEEYRNRGQGIGRTAVPPPPSPIYQPDLNLPPTRPNG